MIKEEQVLRQDAFEKKDDRKESERITYNV